MFSTVRFCSMFLCKTLHSLGSITQRRPVLVYVKLNVILEMLVVKFHYPELSILVLLTLALQLSFMLDY